MGKYANIVSDVFTVFGSAEWTAENIKTLPVNYVGIDIKDEFLRVSVIPSGTGVNLQSISGQLIVDIFTKAGNGPSRPFAIADKLDEYLVGTTLMTQSGVATQFFGSSMSVVGQDKDDPTLFRMTYSVPFTYFEVQQ